MPLLSRSARPLLKQVDNKQHAKEDDHEENSSPLSSARSLSPPKRKPQPDEDIEREPDSSSEEEEPDKTQWHANRGKPAVRRPQGGYLGNIHSNGHEAGKSTAAQESSALSGQDTARSQDDARMDAMTQSSQASNSGGKRKYGRTGSTGYGKSVKKQRTESDSKSGFKKPPQASASPKKGAPKFKAPQGVSSAHGFRATADSSSQTEPSSQKALAFELPRGMEFGLEDEDKKALDATEANQLGPSSPLSSVLSDIPEDLPLDGDDEVEELDLPEPGRYISAVECPMCGNRVESSFKEEFEIEHCRGKRMTYKQQKQFCKAHKDRSAQQLWDERGYPRIDWDSLEHRLKRHQAQIRDILNGTRKSYYRNQLEERVRSGNAKTAGKAFQSEPAKGSNAGYYGSKGEKFMGDFILRAFTRDIRLYAANNKLLASVGTEGGISGFVQTVLVPELAVALIMEDMDAKEREAREILNESGLAGALLNEEEHQKVAHVAREGSPVFDFDEIGGTAPEDIEGLDTSARLR